MELPAGYQRALARPSPATKSWFRWWGGDTSLLSESGPAAAPAEPRLFLAGFSLPPDELMLQEA